MLLQSFQVALLGIDVLEGISSPCSNNILCAPRTLAQWHQAVAEFGERYVEAIASKSVRRPEGRLGPNDSLLRVVE